MPTLALVVIARDEEKGLPLAIASVRPLVDEIVVAVDRRTTDRTREVAREAIEATRTARGTETAFAAAVIEVRFEDFAQMRNAALDAVRSDWILMLDADEVLEGDPRPLMERRPAIWEFPRRHWLDLDRTRPAPDDRHYPDRQARLFPNDGSVRFERPVHEVAEGRTKRRCKTVVIHHLKEALRSPELLAERERVYRDLVERGREEGHRFRKGKDY